MPERIRVLIADDAEQVRQSIRAMLDLGGDFVVVGEVADGRAAVEMARRLRPDVVLMDIHMPILDGISATEAITAPPDSGCAVVIISVHGEPEYLERARRAGASEYLVKPFGLDELIDATRQAAGRPPGSTDPCSTAGTGKDSRGRGQGQLASAGLTPGVGFPTLDLAWKSISPDDGPGRVLAWLRHRPHTAGEDDG